MEEGKLFSNYIARLRKENKVSLHTLCDGLCTFQEISYLEKGTRRLEPLVEDMLLERLGVGAEDDEFYLDYPEYQRWLCRLRILHSIAYEQLQKAEDLLEKYRGSYCRETENRDTAPDDIPARHRLERHFYLSMLAQIRRRREASGPELYAIFREALELTVPSADSRPLAGMALSLKELNLMLEAERYREGGCRPQRCREIIAYIETRILDRRGQAKIYPKAVCCLVQALLDQRGGASLEPRTAAGLFRLCNRALNILRDNGRAYHLWELLSLRETLFGCLPENLFSRGNPHTLESLRRENREWMQVLESLSGEFHVPPETFDYCYLYVMKGAYCISEVISVRRRMLGISQEELCRGICSVRTLRRLESGGTSPHRPIVSDLFERLGLPRALSRTELTFAEPEARMLMEKIKECCNDKRWDDVDKMTERLKQIIPLEIKCNLQAVRNVELCSGRHRKKISSSEYHRQMLETLELTLPYGTFLSEGPKYLTISEQTCVQNLMLVMDRDSPEFLTCLRRLEEIYRPYGDGEILDAVSGNYEFIVGYAGSERGDMGQYDKADEYNGIITHECLRLHRLTSLHDSLYDRWWNYDQRRKKGIPAVVKLNSREELMRCLLLSRFNRHGHSEQFYLNVLTSLSD